jgi:orotate phosphoribosyltransferase-like protein
MSITSKASAMADEGISAEDIAAKLGTTPAVIRVLIDRTNKNGRHLHIRLPDDVYDEILTIAVEAECNVKTVSQMMLIEEIRKRTHADS